MRKYFFCLFVLSLAFAEGKGGIEVELEDRVQPWFTGPLLAPTPKVIPGGYINVEPYFYNTITHAIYDEHWHPESIPNFYTINPQLFLQIGLTEWMDLQTTPQFSWNHTENQSTTGFNDYDLGFDFQLISRKEEDWWPFVKLTLGETFPTGKYQRLNPEKLGTDSLGSGSYRSRVGLTFGRIYWLGGKHYLSTRLFGAYYIPSKVHVHGFNSYGGGFETNGFIYPGQSFKAILGLEYSLTQNWVLALDVQYLHSARTSFKGKRGFNIDGTPAEVGIPSFEQLSFAPALEYNWSEAWGILGGCWFTATGRNSADFASVVIAINYYGSWSGKKLSGEDHGGGGR